MSEYVGFDVSKEETAFCVKDENGGDKLVHGSGGISQPRAE